MNIEKSIAYYMLIKKVNQKELAKRAGLAEETLSRAKAGRPASIETIQKLAKACKVQVRTFIRHGE